MWNRHLSRATAWCLGVLCLIGASRPVLAAETLFNGKDLDGWRYYLVDHAVGMDDVWSVRNGVLVCKGDPLGYLYTKKAFKNYRLQVEWRWPGKPGNSGLFQRLNGKPGFLPRCMEVQLQSGNAGDIYAFQGMSLSGDSARFRNIKHKELGDFVGVAKITGNEKDPGEWNLAEVVVDGSTIKVWVNGKLVNEATNCEVVAGPIGLQSEGGEIEFRKVEVAPLPD
ncbi:MAG: DUF1080 domain-containing protein [Bacillota bacterium]